MAAALVIPGVCGCSGPGRRLVQMFYFARASRASACTSCSKGGVDILVGDNVIETASEGDIVGEMALIDNASRSASVIANTECRLVGIDRERFHLLVQRNPTFSTHVMKVLANRLRHMNWLVLASPKS